MRRLLALLLFLPLSAVSAPSSFYGEVHVGAGGVRHSELDFYPVMGGVTAGAYVLPNIGIEIFADSGFSEGEDSDIDVELEEAFGVAARFQSPGQRGLHGYIVLGYVDFSLAQTSELPSSAVAGDAVASSESAVDERFTGPRFSVGVMQRLRRFPALLLSAEYRNYYSDSSISVDGFLLGLRVNLP